MSGPRSTTQPILRRLLGYLLLATVAVFGSTLWAFHRVHDAADSVHTRTAPAILGLMTARHALVTADDAAIRSFRSNAVLLTGPSQEYQNQFTIASQSLNQVAESNAAGEVGSRTLQLVEGMLVAYTELIGQANVHYWQGDRTMMMGITDVWSASHLLHNEDGILAQLDKLLELERQTFDHQLADSSTTVLVVLVAVGPAVLLLGLLGLTQVVLRRRFRRVLNPLLLLATLALAGLSVIISLVFGAREQLATSRITLQQMIDDAAMRAEVTDATGRQEMVQLLPENCRQPAGGCGVTVDKFLGKPASQAALPDEGQLARRTRIFNDETAAAVDGAGPELLIYALTALIASTVLFGLRPRLSEYRYRLT